jgi:hypothetical protein
MIERTGKVRPNSVKIKHIGSKRESGREKERERERKRERERERAAAVEANLRPPFIAIRNVAS